jgi:U4/U6.U5 tri-snRNP-associated protein 1
MCVQKKKRHNNKRVIESSMRDASGTADGDEKMQVDEKPIIPEARDLDVNFVDDDDLQAVLARSRKAKLRKPQKLSPEDVARKSKFLFAPFVMPHA